VKQWSPRAPHFPSWSPASFSLEPWSPKPFGTLRNVHSVECHKITTVCTKQSKHNEQLYVMISDIHFAKKTYIEQHRQAFQDPTAILCKNVVTR